MSTKRKGEWGKRLKQRAKKLTVEAIEPHLAQPLPIVALPDPILIEEIETRHLTVQNLCWSIRFASIDGTHYTLLELATLLRSVADELDIRAGVKGGAA